MTYFVRLQAGCSCSALPLQGFLSPETMRALDFFEQATDCFRRALNEVRMTSVFLQQLCQ